MAAWNSPRGTSPSPADLPAGLRIPQLYQITDLGDDRLLVWMEDVDAFGYDVWTRDMFVRAAYVLGGLAALRGTPEILGHTGLPPGYGLRRYTENRVKHGALPTLDDDGVWRHPLVGAVVDRHLRADLRRIAAALPVVLDRLDALPQAVPHGDASPQNLLVPRDSPDEFVAIDISFQCPLAIGFDLGQLLIGLAHAGLLTAAALPAIHDSLVPAFVAGMAAHGVEADPADVAYGYVGSLVVRAGLTSMPFELLGRAAVGRPRHPVPATCRADPVPRQPGRCPDRRRIARRLSGSDVGRGGGGPGRGDQPVGLGGTASSSAGVPGS